MNASAVFSVDLPDEAATLDLGRRLAGLLVPNDVLALVGNLGAGKTTLVRGIVAGLGIDEPGIVASPTFVLVNEYPARLYVYHVDAYRLRSPEELEAVGIAEMCNSGGVVIVEWADRVPELIPPGAVWIDLAGREPVAVASAPGRRLSIRAAGDRAAEVGEALRRG